MSNETEVSRFGTVTFTEQLLFLGIMECEVFLLW